MTVVVSVGLAGLERAGTMPFLSLHLILIPPFHHHSDPESRLLLYLLEAWEGGMTLFACRYRGPNFNTQLELTDRSLCV